MEKEYRYVLHPDNSPDVFKSACEIVEKSYPNLKKMDLLVDVDGSTAQIYGDIDDGIIVHDDYTIGSVYIKSDIDLSELFGRQKHNVA